MEPDREWLVIDCGPHKVMIDVKESYKIFDLRALIEDQLDDGMVPSEYSFWCQGVLFAGKQEQRKRAVDFIGKDLCIRPKSSANYFAKNPPIPPTMAQFQTNPVVLPPEAPPAANPVVPGPEAPPVVPNAAIAAAAAANLVVPEPVAPTNRLTRNKDI